MMSCTQARPDAVGRRRPERCCHQSVVGSALVGTAIGAVAGAALGGEAGTGAGVGLLAGTAVGASSGAEARHTVQQRYDIAYEQCMYAKGHQIPMAGRYAPYRQSRQVAPPPPPPPAGTPPPPPPKPS